MTAHLRDLEREGQIRRQLGAGALLAAFVFAALTAMLRMLRDYKSLRRRSRHRGTAQQFRQRRVRHIRS
jgi:hypothetical protein